MASGYRTNAPDVLLTTCSRVSRTVLSMRLLKGGVVQGGSQDVSNDGLEEAFRQLHIALQIAETISETI